MKLLYYYLRRRLLCCIKKADWGRTDCYKGWRLYKDVNCSSKKKLLQVFIEAEKLSKIWHCWPDTYFRFGMFLKDFGNMDKMKSFVPQAAYSRYSADKDPKYHILIDDKILFHNIMTMYNLPVPERFFVFQDKEFRKDGEILPDGMVDEILDKVEDERIFIKRYRGGAGSGISIAEKKRWKRQ